VEVRLAAETEQQAPIRRERLRPAVVKKYMHAETSLTAELTFHLDKVSREWRKVGLTLESISFIQAPATCSAIAAQQHRPALDAEDPWDMRI
jgi:hypothetical protein